MNEEEQRTAAQKAAAQEMVDRLLRAARAVSLEEAPWKASCSPGPR